MEPVPTLTPCQAPAPHALSQDHSPSISPSPNTTCLHVGLDDLSVRWVTLASQPWAPRPLSASRTDSVSFIRAGHLPTPASSCRRGRTTSPTVSAPHDSAGWFLSRVKRQRLGSCSSAHVSAVSRKGRPLREQAGLWQNSRDNTVTTTQQQSHNSTTTTTRPQRDDETPPLPGEAVTVEPRGGC